jgi:hypothetical protein
MFGWVAKLFSSPCIEDPVFGKLHFQSVGFWEGRCHFPPVAKEIDITVDADLSGPTELHRRFFNEQCERWPSLLQSSQELFMEPAKSWIDDFSPNRLWDYLDLEGIGVPNPTWEEPSWEATFWCDDAGHWFDVSFEGWTAKYVSVNG